MPYEKPNGNKHAVNSKSSVPLWLPWTRRLPRWTQLWLARRWQRIARVRAAWAEFILGSEHNNPKNKE